MTEHVAKALAEYRKSLELCETMCRKLEGEKQELRSQLYAIRGAAAFGPPNAETLKTICGYVDDALERD